MDRLPFEKVKPYRDAKALAAFAARNRRCAVKGCRYSAHPHHIKAKSLGGGDEESNLLPLCPMHHTGPSGPHQQGHARWFGNYESLLSDEDAAKVRAALRLEAE